MDVARQIVSAAFALALVSAAPAFGQEKYTLPRGCDGILTAQRASCSVIHFYSCKNDPSGYLRFISIAAEGINIIVTQSDDGMPMSIDLPLDGVSLVYSGTGKKTVSNSQLIETGFDEFDYKMSSRFGSFGFVGEMELTGAIRVIDGRTLDETQINMGFYNPDGSLNYRETGKELFDRQLGYHFNVFTHDGRNALPLDFIYPHETGFLAKHPVYDCYDLISEDLSGQKTKEKAHDQI